MLAIAINRPKRYVPMTPPRWTTYANILDQRLGVWKGAWKPVQKLGTEPAPPRTPWLVWGLDEIRQLRDIGVQIFPTRLRPSSPRLQLGTFELDMQRVHEAVHETPE